MLATSLTATCFVGPSRERKSLRYYRRTATEPESWARAEHFRSVSGHDIPQQMPGLVLTP